jgi:hypothetical protein
MAGISMDLEVLTLDAFLLPNDWSVIGVGTTTAAGVLGTDDEDEVSRRRDAFEVPLGVEKV